MAEFPRHPMMADGHLNQCGECRRQYRADYYKRKAEQVKAKVAERYEVKRDEINAVKRKRYESDPEYRERVAEIAKRSREKNRETEARKAKRRYLANRRERIAAAKEWGARHPELLAEYQRRRRSRRVGVKVSLTREEWAEICEASDNRCAYCGSDERLGMDHLLPTKRGGSHSKENVVLCCNSCNASKGQMTPVEWIRAGGKWRAKSNRGRTA